MRQPEYALTSIDKIGISLLLSGCATLIGATYMFGYWRPFGFDVFPYASPTDYISAPLNRLSILAVTPFLLALIIFGNQRSTNKLPIKWISVYLIALCSVIFLFHLYKAIDAFLQYDFKYDNEMNVLFVSIILFIGGIVTEIRSYKETESIRFQGLALLLVLIANSMSAGYADGKTLFNGTDRAFLLENKEMCDATNDHEWAFIGKVGEQTFFINTHDKRLCLTVERNYRLKPRKYH